MKATSKILLTLFLLFTITLTYGQSNAEAKNLLNEVSKKVKSYNNISIGFKYELKNVSENISQETKGDVTIDGEKYILNILGITRIFDGKTLYNISHEDEEVTISSQNVEDEGTISPTKMMTFYDEGYTYKMDIVQNVRGRKIQYVKLTPIDSNSEIKHVLLGIDATTKHIYNLIEIGKNETKTTLTVTEFRANQVLPKNSFTFNKSRYSDYFINTID